MSKTPILFSREKLIYPYIISYYSSIHGALDATSRSLTRLLRDSDNDPNDVRMMIMFSKTADDLRRFIESTPTPLYYLHGSRFRSSVDEDIDLNLQTVLLDEFYDRMSIGATGVMVDLFDSMFTTPMRALIITTYEVVRDDLGGKDDWDSDLWKFYFHIRNAAAHNGKIKFSKLSRRSLSERPVRWRGKTIDCSMEGKNLFTIFNQTTETFSDPFMENGDMLYLLKDIEDKYL